MKILHKGKDTFYEHFPGQVQPNAVKTFPEGNGTFHENSPIRTQVSAVKTFPEECIPMQSGAMKTFPERNSTFYENSPIQTQSEDKGTTIMTGKSIISASNCNSMKHKVEPVKYHPLLKIIGRTIIIQLSFALSHILAQSVKLSELIFPVTYVTWDISIYQVVCLSGNSFGKMKFVPVTCKKIAQTK